MKERREFTEEFKREAVRLARDRGNLVQTARELGLHETVLQRWKKRLEETPESEKPFPGKGNPRDEQIDKLRRELARVKEENEILKKPFMNGSSPSEMKMRGVLARCPRRVFSPQSPVADIRSNSIGVVPDGAGTTRKKPDLSALVGTIHCRRWRRAAIFPSGAVEHA